MTHAPITHVDLFPDFATMTTGTLEDLCDQVFTQLEDGPLVEGLFAFYLSALAELEDRTSGSVDVLPSVADLSGQYPTAPALPAPREAHESSEEISRSLPA